MKWWLIGLWVILFGNTKAQSGVASFSSIDWKMQNTDAPTPDSLARIIAASYITEPEKVRAIYSWITAHIAYNTNTYKNRSASYSHSPDPLDTASVWPSGDEMVARKVMRRRMAVCDGYARLFKVLCGYTGVKAEIIQGYGRTYGTGTSKKFTTNHTWNAVQIDSVWKLLDVTWASGHLDFRNEFVAKQNDFYFLTPPEQFINDHYPEELRWTLLPNPPSPAEFKRAPFRSKHFFKYGVGSFFPESGVIEAAVGDTISFSFQLRDVARAKNTSADPFMDTATYTLWPLSSFIKPTLEKGAFISYNYIVQPFTEWVHLLYNDDVIMGYRITIADKVAKNK